MDIYVGNLSLETSEKDLQQQFGLYGKVTSVNIIKDRVNGQALGFGFVEMAEHNQARKAINALNKTKIKDRTIMVNEAKITVERRKSARK